jgi:hypothetical protein
MNLQVWGVMSMHQHTVNYTHFAQLFMHQLTTMCRSVSLHFLLSHLTFLSDLKKVQTRSPLDLLTFTCVQSLSFDFKEN